jgi:hypothetical protein
VEAFRELSKPWSDAGLFAFSKDIPNLAEESKQAGTKLVGTLTLTNPRKRALFLSKTLPWGHKILIRGEIRPEHGSMNIYNMMIRRRYRIPSVFFASA